MSDLLIRVPEEKKRKITSYLKRNKIEYTKVQSSKKKKMVDLTKLSGIVSVGGDALEDTEKFYSKNSS